MSECERRWLMSHLDVFEVKQVSLHEGAQDLLIGPCDEQLVIVIGLWLPWRFIPTCISQPNHSHIQTGAWK